MGESTGAHLSTSFLLHRGGQLLDRHGGRIYLACTKQARALCAYPLPVLQVAA